MVVPPPPSKSKSKKIKKKTFCDAIIVITILSICLSNNKSMHLACYYTDSKIDVFRPTLSIILTVCMFRKYLLGWRRVTRPVTGTKQTPLRNHLPIFRLKLFDNNLPETVATPALHLHKVIVCTALFYSPRRG
jgi:hypothetical protein